MTQTDAHMPPQPVEPNDDSVWGNAYNPDTNEWSPSSEQHSVFGVAEPAHTDEPDADPMSEQYGRYEGAGSVPDVRANLLTDVKDRGAIPVTPLHVEHTVRTEDVASSIVRLRTIGVVGNATPTTLLDENPQRRRALIKILTATTSIIISPLRQGGVPALTAVPTQPVPGWVLSTADNTLELKTQAGVECVGITASALCLVMVLEELNSVQPGIGR